MFSEISVKTGHFFNESASKQSLPWNKSYAGRMYTIWDFNWMYINKSAFNIHSHDLQYHFSQVCALGKVKEILFFSIMHTKSWNLFYISYPEKMSYLSLNTSKLHEDNGISFRYISKGICTTVCFCNSYRMFLFRSVFSTTPPKKFFSSFCFP